MGGWAIYFDCSCMRGVTLLRVLLLQGTGCERTSALSVLLQLCAACCFM